MQTNGRRSGPKATPRYVYDLDTDAALKASTFITRHLVAEIKRLRRELHLLRSDESMKANHAANCQFRGLDDILYVAAWSFRGNPVTYSFYRSKRAHVGCLRRLGMRSDYTYVGSGEVRLGDLLKDATL